MLVRAQTESWTLIVLITLFHFITVSQRDVILTFGSRGHIIYKYLSKKKEKRKEI